MNITRELVDEVHQLKAMPDDWDGKPIQSVCIVAAADFAARLQDWIERNAPKLPLPRIGPTIGGGIVFEWFGRGTDGRELVITFKSRDNNPSITCLASDDRSAYEHEAGIHSFADFETALNWLAFGQCK